MVVDDGSGAKEGRPQGSFLTGLAVLLAAVAVFIPAVASQTHLLQERATVVAIVCAGVAAEIALLSRALRRGHQAVWMIAVAAVTALAAVSTWLWGPTDRLAAPQELHAASNSTEAKLTWQAPAGEVDFYRVYRDGKLIDESSESPNFVDKSVTAGATYIYYVRAVDPFGKESPASEPMTVTATPISQDLLPPADLRATAVSAAAVWLAWEPPPGSPDGGVFLLRRNGEEVMRSSATSFQDTGLKPDTAYSYTVRTRGPGTPGAESADGSALVVRTAKAGQTASAPPPPASPAALSAPRSLRATTTTTSSVTLAWARPAQTGSGLAHYLAYRNGAKAATIGAGATSWTDQGRAGGTAYSYYLKAVDTQGKVSAAGNTVTATTAKPNTSGPAMTRHSTYDWTESYAIDLNSTASDWNATAGSWTSQDIEWHRGATSAGGTAALMGSGDPWTRASCEAHFDNIGAIPAFTSGLRFCLFVGGATAMIQVKSVSSGDPAVARVEIAVWKP